MSESNPDELTLHERLLLDLRTVYADQAKMSTHDITASLYALPASTWAAMWPNRNKAARELAVMLEPLGAAPTMIRFGEETMRGYHRYMLEPLWDEIVSDENDVTDVAATQAVTLDLDEDELLDA
jgi:hypothetical protein